MRTRKSGLLPRIALALALVGLVPLGIATWLLVSGNRRGLERSVFETHMVAVRSAVDRIESHLEARRGLAKAFASNPVLAADARSEVSIELIRGLLARLPDVTSAAVVTDEGGLVLRLHQPGASDAVAALETQHLGEPVVVADIEGRNWVRLEERIPDSNGSFVMVLELEPFGRALEHVTLVETAEMVLADGEGNHIAGAAGVLEAVGDDVLAMAKERGVLGTSRSAGALAAYDKVRVGEETEWLVLSRQPDEVAFASTRKLRRDAMLSLAVASLLVLGLSGLAYTSIVRPIRDLAEAQGELAGTGRGGAAGNEIDQLKSSFEALRRGLHDRDALSETFLGRFQVLDVLGTGAMGMVFRGWDPRLERQVALKTIRVDQAMPAEERDKRAGQLVNEAMTVAALNDPHIVSIYDVEHEADGAFISMELVDGVSLEEYLYRHGCLSQSEVARIGAAVAQALVTAHRSGFVHQDIKPANVLLAQSGQIKVTDFGISSLIASMSAERDQCVFGTPGYLAPEALLGEAFDGRCDLYALGVTLYECVTGRRPFWGKNREETLALTLKGSAAPPRRHGAEIDEDFERLIMELIELDKEKRPADAEEVAVRLERFVPRTEALWRPRVESGRSESESEAEQGEEQAKSQMVPLAAGAAGGVDRLAPTRRIECGDARAD